MSITLIFGLERHALCKISVVTVFNSDFLIAEIFATCKSSLT